MAGRLRRAVAAVPGALGALADAPLARWQRRAGQGGMAAVFLAPGMAVFAVFVLLPLVLNLAYSATSGAALFLGGRDFAGLANYARLLDCAPPPRGCAEDRFWTALGNTALFVALQVPLMVVLATLTALVLDRDLRARAFWRALFFLPVLLSPVVTAVIWRWLLHREGLANALLVAAGAAPVNWLVERGWALAAAVGVTVWAHLGFYALIVLAGLQAIPRDLHEAAAMDGTPRGRVFRRITLPLLAPHLGVVTLLALIRAVQVFDEAYVLTGGGPGTATLFLTQYIYETGFASVLRNLGLAAAASVVMGAALAALTLARLGLGRVAGGRAP